MKDPAVLFYTSDFLTKTITMTDSEVGKYIRLLCLQHQKGFLTKKDMLKICGRYDKEVFSHFDKIEGKYINPRMALEAKRRKEYSESRKSNREKKVFPKTYVPHMVNEDETEDKAVPIMETQEEMHRRIYGEREK